MPLRRNLRGRVAVTTALLALTVVAGPVRAGPVSWLTATPTGSPIAMQPGEAVTVTITNTDRRTVSSRLSVSLARNPTSAPFAVGADTCTGVILAPGGACTVEVRYDGALPDMDHRAALTVSSGKPAKASITRVFEVGVTFGQVCAARGGVAGEGGVILLLGLAYAVRERCDWATVLPTAVYNAAFDAVAGECFDLHAAGAVGYPTGGPTGGTAIGCVVD